MVETVSTKAAILERPTGLLIVVLLEALAGVRYLLDIIIFPSFDLAWGVLVALMLISFLVAYGLWRYAKWAWLLSFILSIFGIASTIFLMVLGGASESLLIQSIPSIIIDSLVVIILLTKNVKKRFWGKAVEVSRP